MEYLHLDDDLHLERIKPGHATTIFGAIDRDREYLRKWLPFVDQTRKLADTENFIRLLGIDSGKERDDVYCIWYKGEFAGLIGYKDSDPINHKTEIGYWLARHMQGKGIMTRCVEKLTDFAFRNLKRNRVQIKVAVGNAKSAAIPKRLGFRYEGTERDGEFHTRRYLDLEIYSFLKKEWIDMLINRVH
ncbi:MAG TPA: GNAT family protein [Prolixibacteraceae bacterium]|nr:GNAT family protein [Prolixibacteraceae bacterium]